MKTEEPERSSCLLPVGVVIAVVVIWALTGILWWLVPDATQRGQFGDAFGAVNALFSGLAFAGLVYTISLQRQELMLQRKELEMTRQELRLTRLESENHNKLVAEQQKLTRLQQRQEMRIADGRSLPIIRLQEKFAHGDEIEFCLENLGETVFGLFVHAEGWNAEQASFRFTAPHVWGHGLTNSLRFFAAKLDGFGDKSAKTEYPIRIEFTLTTGRRAQQKFAFTNRNEFYAIAPPEIPETQ